MSLVSKIISAGSVFPDSLFPQAVDRVPLASELYDRRQLANSLISLRHHDDKNHPLTSVTQFHEAIYRIVDETVPASDPIAAIYPASGANLLAMLEATGAFDEKREWCGVLVSSQQFVDRQIETMLNLEQMVLTMDEDRAAYEGYTDTVARFRITLLHFVSHLALPKSYEMAEVLEGLNEILFPLCVEANLLGIKDFQISRTTDPNTWKIELTLPGRYGKRELVRSVYYTQHFMTDETLFPDWLLQRYLPRTNVALIKSPLTIRGNRLVDWFPYQRLIEKLHPHTLMVADRTLSDFSRAIVPLTAEMAQLKALAPVQKEGVAWGRPLQGDDPSPVFLGRTI